LRAVTAAVSSPAAVFARGTFDWASPLFATEPPLVVVPVVVIVVPAPVVGVDPPVVGVDPPVFGGAVVPGSRFVAPLPHAWSNSSAPASPEALRKSRRFIVVWTSRTRTQFPGI